jgi:glycolate oxidase FAD binding subunit
MDYKPASEGELSAILTSAAKSGSRLKITGGGTRPVGNPVKADKNLYTSKITGISLYEPGALTLVAKAGTTLEEINKVLAEENQQLPFEPTDYAGLFGIKGKSTIGGVVAAAVSGPRRIQAGACRDSLIGVRFVTGEGDIIKNGGRVMKNVTGYDLVKLMCGSHGTLGIITEVAFKVLPRPEVTGVVLVSGLDDATAVKVLSQAITSPFDVSGVAHAQHSSEGGPLTMIRVEGFSDSIRYRTGRLKELIGPLVPSGTEIAIETDATKTAAGWKWIGDVEAFHGRQGALWRLSVKPGDSPSLVSQISSEMPCEAVYDWAGGLVWLLVDDEGDGGEIVIRGAVNAKGGHATLIRASEKMRRKVEAFHPQVSRLVEISEGLRRQFDPAGILNPGLMLRRPILTEA